MAQAEMESPLARRMRELEEEQAELQRRMKDLSRKARKMGAETSTRLPERPVVRSTALPDNREVSVPSAQAVEAVEQESAAGAASAPPSRSTPPRPGNPRAPHYASYLSGGPLGRARPLSQERRLVRNKAIFMLLIAAVLIFIFIRLVF